MRVGLKSCVRAGGGAKTLPGELRGGTGTGTRAESAGGGARKFSLSLKWVQIVGPEVRGGSRG